MRKIVFITISFLIITGFTTVSKKVNAIIKKEIRTVFNIEKFTQHSIAIPIKMRETLPLNITETNFFKINSDDNFLGYYYLGQAYGKAAYFDFIVIFDKNLIVSKVKILVYREDHGGEIGSKRWLKQFIGKTTTNFLIYQKNIAAISGATISAKSMTNEVNKLLKTIDILNKKQQL